MFEKNMRLSYLLDFYGELLDERVRGIMDAYYGDDLSLAEIASDEGMTRQGVRYLIKKGEEQLLLWEDKLGLAEHDRELTAFAGTLLSSADSLDDGTLSTADAAALLRQTARMILTKGESSIVR